MIPIVIIPARRYRAVLLALEGGEAREIGRALDRSRRSAQEWVYAYRDGGNRGRLLNGRGGHWQSCTSPPYCLRLATHVSSSAFGIHKLRAVRAAPEMEARVASRGGQKMARSSSRLVV